jgi:pimeloyl-ACP methyl ester carboxylesterase
MASMHVKRSALIVCLMVVGLSLGLYGCGHSSTPAASLPEPFTVTRMTSPTGQHEVLLVPKTTVRGLVVFSHGYGGSEDQILQSSDLFPLRNALATAGYAIAASNAHGNSYANPVSLDDFVELINDARTRLPSVGRIDLVGFSMGGLAPLMLASEHRVPNVDAVLLLSPVCDQIGYLGSYFGGAIRAAFGHAKGSAPPVIARSDPEKQNPQTFLGPRYWFWMSPADTTVPPSQTAGMVAFLKSAGVDVRYSPLTGNHGDLSHLSVGAVVAWLEA